MPTKPIIMSHNFTLSFNIVGKTMVVMKILEKVLRILKSFGVDNVSINHEMEYDAGLESNYSEKLEEITKDLSDE